MKPVFAVDIGDTIQLDGSSLAKTYPSLGTVVNILLKNSLTIAGILLLALLIIGGLMFVLSAGSDDPKQAQNAQKMITSSLIGFAIVFLSFVIIQLIEVITGLNILNSSL